MRRKKVLYITTSAFAWNAECKAETWSWYVRQTYPHLRIPGQCKRVPPSHPAENHFLGHVEYN